MLLTIYKKASPLQFMLVILLTLALWAIAFESSTMPQCSSRLSLLCPSITSFHGWLNGFPAKISGMLLLIASGFLLAFSLGNNQMINRQSFLPALIVPLFSSYIPLLHSFHPVIPAMILLTGALHYLLNAYEKTDLTREVFSAGFLIGLASLFHLPAIAFALLPFLGLLTYRIADWRQWTSAIIGIITPVLFLLVAMYFFEGRGSMRTYFSGILEWELLTLPRLGWPLLVFWGITLLLLLRSLGSIFIHVNERVISYRKKHIIILWFLLISQGSLLLSAEHYLYHSILIFIPLAYYLTYLFIDRRTRKPWINELIFIIYLISLVFINAFPDYAFPGQTS